MYYVAFAVVIYDSNFPSSSYEKAVLAGGQEAAMGFFVLFCAWLQTIGIQESGT